MEKYKTVIEQLRFMDGVRYGCGYALAIVTDQDQKDKLNKMIDDADEEKERLMKEHNIKEA